MAALRLINLLPRQRGGARAGEPPDDSDAALWRRLHGLWQDMDSETRRCLYRQSRELLRSQWARAQARTDDNVSQTHMRPVDEGSNRD